MNKVILMGRLTKDPDVRYSAGDQSQAFARYTLAVDRRVRRDNNDPNAQSADFIGGVAFGKSAECVEKYLRKGMKIAVTGRIQTGKYTNKDGQTIYTTDVVVEDHEFAESKASSDAYRAQTSFGQGGGYSQPSSYSASSAPAPQPTPAPTGADDGFINIPDGLDEELPFK